MAILELIFVSSVSVHLSLQIGTQIDICNVTPFYGLSIVRKFHKQSERGPIQQAPRPINSGHRNLQPPLIPSSNLLCTHLLCGQFSLRAQLHDLGLHSSKCHLLPKAYRMNPNSQPGLTVLLEPPTTILVLFSTIFYPTPLP